MNKQNEVELEVCQYLDGQLDAQQELDFERRAEADSQLRELVEKYRHVTSLVDELGSDIVDIDENQQLNDILAAVEHRAHGRRSKFQRLVLRPVVGICAAAAIFVIGVCVYLIVIAPSQKSGGAPQVVSSDLPTPGRCAMVYRKPKLQSLPAVVHVDMIAPPDGFVDESVAYSKIVRPKSHFLREATVWAGFRGGGVIAASAGAATDDAPVLPGIFGYVTN